MPHEKGAQLLMAEPENDAVLLEQLYIRLHSVAKELRDLAGTYQQIQKQPVSGYGLGNGSTCDKPFIFNHYTKHSIPNNL